MRKGTWWTMPIALALALAWPLAAWTQDVKAPDVSSAARVATVQPGNAGVRISTRGWPFVTAKPGQPAHAGDRLLLLAPGDVTLVYADGCRQTHDRIGVYTIGADCRPPAPAASGAAPRPDAPVPADTVVDGPGLAARIARQDCACDARPVGH